jgi:hypothetical protein
MFYNLVYRYYKESYFYLIVLIDRKRLNPSNNIILNDMDDGYPASTPFSGWTRGDSWNGF